jgi:hypothetical protein
MLIPSTVQSLADEKSCYMGVAVMGGVVNQFAQALAQMSHCKFLGFANYTIAKPTPGLGAGSVVETNWTVLSNGLNKTSKEYDFLYGSTPLSEWIGVIFQYVATRESSSNSPQVTLRVKNLSGTRLSKDVLFSFPEHLQRSDDGDVNLPNIATTGATFYDPPSGTTGLDNPRPLYVPSANRGDMLFLEVKVEDCDLVSISFFDLYQAERTP